MSNPRDIFIQRLYESALNDKSIILISVDMGAPALDQWRSNLPEQFISAGISEQNAINIAAGLANSGKKVFVYMMASWFARCFEQVRYSCAMANNPITILGNGVGLGYAPSGPAHQPNEDLALARTLLNIEVFSPCNKKSIECLVDLCLMDEKLRYIRLERKFVDELNQFDYYKTDQFKILNKNLLDTEKKIAILSSGHMLKKAIKLYDRIEKDYSCILLDLWKIKPLNDDQLLLLLKNFSHIVTLEEQSLCGGFGSALCEYLADSNIQKSLKRFGLPEKYIFENGSRDHLLDQNYLSIEDLYNESMKFLTSV